MSFWGVTGRPQGIVINVVPREQFVVSAGISETSYAEVVDLGRRTLRRSAVPSPLYRRDSVHGIILAWDNAGFAEILESADIATPDGMLIVWALPNRSSGCTITGIAFRG